MRIPTSDQRQILENTSRVRIVRAAPGSGKTWLVGEIIRRELANWNKPSGIAALSFTRVGGAEIYNAVGYELESPHFVGTLDSYLFRFVIRPFFNKVFSLSVQPRLIPAAWDAKHWYKAPNNNPLEYHGQGGKSAPTYNLLELSYPGQLPNGDPDIVHPFPYHSSLRRINQSDYKELWKKKKESWKKYGWLTHADVTFLACKIINDQKHGQTVRSLISNRFPLIIVDELQDTGYYLGEFLYAILCEKKVRSVLVGDPDQAIYEFNGAKPELFDKFKRLPNSMELLLRESLRCPPTIINVANKLKTSDNYCIPNNQKSGCAFLVIYENMIEDINNLVTMFSGLASSKKITCITRFNKTVATLKKNKKSDELGTLRCPALNHISRAVQSFRFGNNKKALSQVEACLSLWIFDFEGIDQKSLEKKGLLLEEWRRLCIMTLLECVKIDSNLKFQEWQEKAGVVIDKTIKASDLPETIEVPQKKMKPNNLSGTRRKKSGADDKMALYFPEPQPNNDIKILFQTVHSVKGETHDITIFVCPEPKLDKKCPSETWWSTQSEELEEKRIAYVAITRTQRDLILCVSRTTYNNLSLHKKDFVELFKEVSMEECRDYYSNTST